MGIVTTYVNGTLVSVPDTSYAQVLFTPSHTNLNLQQKVSGVYIVGNVGGALLFGSPLSVSNGTLSTPTPVSSFRSPSGTTHTIYYAAFAASDNVVGQGSVRLTYGSIGYTSNSYSFYLVNGQTRTTVTTTTTWYNNGANASFSIDTVKPTVQITADSAALDAGQSTIVSFKLSSVSTTFSSDDIKVTGGVLSDFAGSGNTYTAKFTASTLIASQQVTANISISDSAFTALSSANPNAAISWNLAVNPVIPEIRISGNPLQGQTLTASTTVSHPSGKFVWRTADGLVELGEDATYALQQGDVGKNIRVDYVFTNAYGALDSISSPGKLKLVIGYFWDSVLFMV
jgi:hypothetical protein